MSSAGEERGRLHVRGHLVGTGGAHMLLFVHEPDGAWTIHGLGATAVRLEVDVMILVAESILKRARNGGAQ